MEIKIQPGSGMADVAGADPSSRPESTSALPPATGSDDADPVSRIAMDVVSNRITVDQAVNQILEHVMSMDVVASAPAALREEVAEMLRTAIETDPSIASLVHRMRD